MTTLASEIEKLTSIGLLPDSDYLEKNRFITPYSKLTQFGVDLAYFPGLPIATALGAAYYSIGAVWATLRTIGNLLILRPGYAAESISDVGIDLTLAVGLAVMTPIHALISGITLLTRTIASWLRGEEPRDDLTKISLMEKFTLENKEPYLLLSADYFNKSRFFSPYKNVTKFLGQTIAPVATVVSSAFECLLHALGAISAAIKLLGNIVICKPRHALENARDLSVDISLTLSIALMTPINAIVETIAIVSRLGSTWVAACMRGDDEEMNQPLETALSMG
jgi:hypothetical protein